MGMCPLFFCVTLFSFLSHFGVYFRYKMNFCLTLPTSLIYIEGVSYQRYLQGTSTLYPIVVEPNNVKKHCSFDKQSNLNRHSSFLPKAEWGSELQMTMNIYFPSFKRSSFFWFERLKDERSKGDENMNLTNCSQEMKKLRFGVEIEMGEISIEKTAKLMAQYFSQKYNITSTAQYDGGYYREWSCKDHKGRKWKGMTDGSSSGTLGSISCEMVTPLLEYDDIPILQDIVRIFRQNGAKSGVGYNAGVHIHVDAEIDIIGRNISSRENGQTAKTIRNLVNSMNSHNTILVKSINVSSMRRGWCRPVDTFFLQRMNGENKPRTLREVGIAWYGSERDLNRVLDDPHGNHYNDTRYQILNLHSMFTGKGFEFRCFEFHKGLHAGELKAWIQVCLAMVQYAKMVRYSRQDPIDMSNEKYAMNSWLKNMGLIGEEFKTCRKHMLKRLSGDTAYRNGRPSLDEDDLIDMTTSDYIEG